MANIDKDIKRIMGEIIEDGTLDTILKKNIADAFDRAISNSLMFGELHDAIHSKINAVLTRTIESYDMSQYLVKLDDVLCDIVNSTTLVDNKTILKNFKNLMTEPDKNQITVSELFKAYGDYVSKNMDTCGREVDYYDGYPSYVPMEIRVNVVRSDRPWSCFEKAVVEFNVGECKQNDNLCKGLILSRFKGSHPAYDWHIEQDGHVDILSLRYMDDFNIFITRLSRSDAAIVIDIEEDTDDVKPEKEPEPTFE